MADSLADLLRASVENATDPDPLELVLPVFNPPITMQLVRIKDAKQREANLAGLDKIGDDVQRVLEAAARTLPMACKSCYVEINGERHELPPVGAALYEYIYPENPQPSSDPEAVFALYTDAKGETDTAALADAAIQYADWSQTDGLRAHEAVLKN